MLASDLVTGMGTVSQTQGQGRGQLRELLLQALRAFEFGGYSDFVALG